MANPINHITVNQYLGLVNDQLKQLGNVRVIGEITKINCVTHYYFTLKDKSDGSVMDCAIWLTKYKMCGVELKEGQEIIVTGMSNVHAKSGRFTFIADTVELYGEGALKIAFEKLKKKLESEGLFKTEKKKKIPMFPKKIGLITSKTGDAIVDFRTNLGKFGFEITFIDSRVEGQLAVEQLILSVRTMKTRDIDVLVLVRGGGSLESLQAYNNESLVRELASFPKPIITGIGHEKDVTLVDLIADKRESTPTGASKFLNVTWELLLNKIRESREKIRNQFGIIVKNKKHILSKSFSLIQIKFRGIIRDYNQSKEQTRIYLSKMIFNIKTQKKDLSNSWNTISSKILHSVKEYQTNIDNIWSILKIKIKNIIKEVKNFIENTKKQIDIRNPKNQLKLGYSLVRYKGNIVKNIEELNINDMINIEISNGVVDTEIKKIIKK